MAYDKCHFTNFRLVSLFFWYPASQATLGDSIQLFVIILRFFEFIPHQKCDNRHCHTSDPGNDYDARSRTKQPFPKSGKQCATDDKCRNVRKKMGSWLFHITPLLHDYSTINLPRSIPIWHWKPYSPGFSGVNSNVTCLPSGNAALLLKSGKSTCSEHAELS